MINCISRPFASLSRDHREDQDKRFEVETGSTENSGSKFDVKSSSKLETDSKTPHSSLRTPIHSSLLTPHRL